MVVKITNNAFGILAIYRTDYFKSMHVRAMAKVLGTSHVALLPHLKFLEKAKILNTSISGRNKQYILNPENILAKYYLATVEQLTAIDFLEKNFLMQKLADHINKIDFIQPLILFGSYVKGYATEESDIDLFSIGELDTNQQNHLKKFGATFGKKINTKCTSPENFDEGLRKGDSLIREVTANHIIICNPDPYVTLMWRQYVER